MNRTRRIEQAEQTARSRTAADPGGQYFNVWAVGDEGDGYHDAAGVFYDNLEKLVELVALTHRLTLRVLHGYELGELPRPGESIRITTK